MPLYAAPKLSFGQICVQKLRALEQARLRDDPDPAVRFPEVAEIIDAELAAYLLTQTPSLPVSAKSKAGTNIPPTPEEVTAYSASIGYPLDGQAFCDSYEVKGWLVGKVKMKNWQAAVRNWKQNKWGKLVMIQIPGVISTKDYNTF